MSLKIKPSLVLASALSLISPIAFADAAMERHSAAQKIYPQHQLKSEKLKSAHPKGKKSKNINKESFPSFEAKKIEVIFKDNYDTGKKLGLDKYLNTKIDEAKLAEIKQLVKKYYEDQDYLMPQVRFDEKSSKKGVLRLEVYPVRISNVVVLGEGEHNKLIKDYASKITSQDVACRSYTEKMLGLANKVPGIDVAY